MAAAVNEDAHKKNTDCVFFLASPLTCEKGNGCEFRHSEIARNNPRDCWYWLSGSCLNANCAFRHPPLDAVPEGELAAGGGRSRVPCYYFMQGFCARGDKCNFWHGLATASATEGSQKGSKLNVPKVEVSESQTSANKGNGSATSKCSFEAYDATIEMRSQKEDHVVKEVDLPVLPECSDSPARARSQLLEQANLSDRPKQASAIDVRLNHVHPSGEKFLQQEPEAEDDQLCGFQPCNDGLGQDPSGEDLIQEGSESEEMWEESSFDVLVDDGGTDQLIYADELDYLNPYDALVEQLARGTDGFIDFDYDHVSAYGQYHDAEYELATYDAYEQQLLHEQLSSVDPEDHRQPIMALKNRHGKDLLPRVRRGMTFDGEARPQRLNVDSNDLRNHIVKRRRAEKNQNYGDDNDRRRHQDNGSHHNRRHRDGHFKQQEGPARRHMSPRSGSRSGRQYTGRGEFGGNRQFHERFEQSGGKRPFRDLASDHEATGSERGSGKKSRAMNDTFKAKARKERGRPAITGVDEPLRSRGYQQTEKVESRKVDSSFTGPKSLAQIKAEKLKVIQERGLSRQHDGDIECNGTIEELHGSPATDMKSKVSHRFYKERVSEGTVKHPNTMMPVEVDFEGPKPLSVILRQKRKGQREANINDADEEDTGIKDRSYREKATPFQNTSGSGMRKFQPHNPVNTVSELTNVRAYHPVDMHDSQLDRQVEPALDMEEGLDVGDNMMEDIDFDDEEEDDFAEKLGGFLS